MPQKRTKPKASRPVRKTAIQDHVGRTKKSIESWLVQLGNDSDPESSTDSNESNESFVVDDNAPTSTTSPDTQRSLDREVHLASILNEDSDAGTTRGNTKRKKAPTSKPAKARAPKTPRTTGSEVLSTPIRDMLTLTALV